MTCGGWLGEAKCCVYYVTQLVLAYSWAKPAILAADKGRGGLFLCLLFLLFHLFPFLPCLPSFISTTISFISLLPFSWRWQKMTHKGWRVIKPKHNVWHMKMTKTRAGVLLTNHGLGGSVGCAVQLETRRSRVQSQPRSATFFRVDWLWNIFYSHSLPSTDSRRAVVSFWRKNVHNTG